MAGEVWFGTRDDIGWVPAPLTGAVVGAYRWQDTRVSLNGGAYTVQSATQHRRFSLNWGTNNLAELDKILRTINRGELIHYVDPVTAQYNAIPPYWAEYAEDAPPLFPGVQNELVSTEKSRLGYRAEALKYTVTKTVRSNCELYVPEGLWLFLGVHGQRTGTAEFLANDENIPFQTIHSSQRTMTKLPGNRIYTLGFRGSGDITLNGITAVIADKEPSRGGFVSGYGHSGLMIDGEPQITEYSAAIPNAQISLTANFVEVGAWQ